MKRIATPTRVIKFFASLFVIFTTGSVWISLSGHAILLGESQILYLFSTSAQVIAAIYGLTLTGFIFLRNELSREEFEDETLAEAVEALKAKYFTLLVFMTILVMLTLLLANLAISWVGSAVDILTALIVNAGQSAFVTSLLAISYFVFDVTSPKRIERASKVLQSRFDPTLTEGERGSLEDFVRVYNEIEQLLGEAGQVYEENIGTGYAKRQPRRMSNARLAETLYRNEKIDKFLYSQLRDLITLRNSIIHGADPAVSKDVNNAAAGVLNALRSTLKSNKPLKDK